MKTLLLLCGMTPDITILYHNAINRIVREKYGGHNNAPLYMYSANLEEMIRYASTGDWESFTKVYTDPITALAAKDGAAQIDGVVVSAILAHKVARQLSAALKPSGVPLLHIADFLAAHLKEKYPSAKKLGLLGPKVTMLEVADPDFFIGRLQNAENGFTVIVPESSEDIDEVNRGMLEEVAKGAAAVTAATKAMFVAQATALIKRGAQVIVLSSTDLGFVLRGEDVEGDVPFVEPGLIHAEGVAKWACEESK